MDSRDSIAYENRFGQAADAFRAFRPGYPPEVFQRILAVVQPENRHFAIDLGSGTGLSAIPLCEWFDDVIAVEPDPLMAAGLVGKNPRLTVRNVTAEDADFAATSADLVACGTAFHWMNGPVVLARVRDWLRPGGVLAIYSYPVPEVDGAVQKMIDREFELHWNPYRHPRLDDKDYTERTFREYSGLRDLQFLKIPHVVYFSPEEAVGFARSTSYGSAYIRTLKDPQPYLAELLAGFKEASGGKPIAVDFGLSMFIGRKK